MKKILIIIVAVIALCAQTFAGVKENIIELRDLLATIVDKNSAEAASKDLAKLVRQKNGDLLLRGYLDPESCQNLEKIKEYLKAISDKNWFDSRALEDAYREGQAFSYNGSFSYPIKVRPLVLDFYDKPEFSARDDEKVWQTMTFFLETMAFHRDFWAAIHDKESADLAAEKIDELSEKLREANEKFAEISKQMEAKELEVSDDLGKYFAKLRRILKSEIKHQQFVVTRKNKWFDSILLKNNFKASLEKIFGPES